MTIRILVTICAFLLGSCAQAAELNDALPPEGSVEAVQSAPEALPGTIQSLLRYALDQDGTAYRRGGLTPESGFDCSGFVRYVFDRVEGVTLPHSARAISRIGSRIKMAELRPGDLVFFRFMRHTVSHVGIYLGDNRFIHASSIHTGGVRISSLSSGYWTKRFVLARRLDLPSAQSPTISE